MTTYRSADESSQLPRAETSEGEAEVSLVAESLTIKLDSGIRALLTEHAAKQGAGEKIEETARRLLSQAVWEATNPRDDWEFQTVEADDNARTVTFERHAELRREGAASAARRLARQCARRWFGAQEEFAPRRRLLTEL